MVWVDYLIPAIIAISAVISLLRGFVREAISLVGWFISFVVSIRYFSTLSELFFSNFATLPIRNVVAFAILFVITLMLVAIINHLIGHLVQQAGLSGTDRMLGIIFGVIRGGLVVTLLVFLAGVWTSPEEPWWPWWGESLMIVHFQQLAGWLQSNVAPEIARYF